MNKQISAIAFVGAIISTTANTASASEGAYPNISGEWLFETQLEHGFQSDDVDGERTNLFGRSEFVPTIELNDNFSVDATVVLEPLQDSKAGNNTAFSQEGIFVEKFKMNYENGPWGAFAGKFNPDFGKGWDWGRGVWGEDFAEDYEVTQKIGFGGSYTLDTPNSGSHTFTASTFYNDTTLLSESVLTRLDRVRQSDGGAGNTQDLSSYVLGLTGEDVAGIDDLTYQIGFRHLAAADNSATGDDENGYTFGGGYVFPVSEDVSMDALVEYVNIQNFEGATEDRQYIYANLVTNIYEDWNVTTGYTYRKTEDIGLADVNDNLFQLTGGYDFGNGLTLEGGWRSSEEVGADTNIIGGLARYILEF